MRVDVYRSNQKLDTYLYVEAQAALDTTLPEHLQQLLGEVEKVMTVDLNQRDALAAIASKDLKKRLGEDGYWIQLPPTEGHILDSPTCPV